MLATVFSSIGMSIINGVLDKFLAAFVAYENKQISIEELRVRLHTSMLESIKDVEVSHADALAKTYASFMGAMVQSKLMQTVWASVAISQLLVLLWHQVGIPAIVAIGIVTHYPSSGETVSWAYALLGGCVGMGPLVLRTGPGIGSLTERLKAAIGK